MTPFGEVVRRLRAERCLLLADLAQSLEVSPAFLSAIETGRKPIPAQMPTRVARVMSLSRVDTAALKAAADSSQRVVRLDLSNASPLQRDVAVAFARGFEHVSASTLQRIRDLLTHTASET